MLSNAVIDQTITESIWNIVQFIVLKNVIFYSKNKSFKLKTNFVFNNFIIKVQKFFFYRSKSNDVQ